MFQLVPKSYNENHMNKSELITVLLCFVFLFSCETSEKSRNLHKEIRVFSFSSSVPQFQDNRFTTYVTDGPGDIFSFIQNQKYVPVKHSKEMNYLKKIIVVNQDTMYFFKKFNSVEKVEEFEKFVLTTSYKKNNFFQSISLEGINCVVLIDHYDQQSYSHCDTFYFNDKNELFHQSKIYEFKSTEFNRFFRFLPSSFFKN
jgi:hypothetical protein